MLGDIYACHSCRFEIDTGYNHHSGGISVVCKSCGACFLLHLAEDGLGFSIGEKARLLLAEDDEFVETGIEVFPLVKKPLYLHTEGSDEPLEMWSIDCRNLACPQCQQQGTLESDFKEGEQCPVCKQGKLFWAGAVVC